MNKHYPVLFHNSRYAERLPIGEKDILEHCSYETLRSFYRDWYRPDLMAVVAVGDFDKKMIQSMITKHFKKLTNRKPERPRTIYKIPDNDKTTVSVATDKELPVSIAYVFYTRDPKPEVTAGDYRTSILNQLYDGMFNNRIQERLQQPNPPFVFGFGADVRWIGNKQAYQLLAQMREGSILDGLKYIVTEAYRVKEHGFTATELERQKKEQLRRMEQLYKERDKTESKNYASEYIRNFLQQEPIPGIAEEYEMNKQFLPGINLDEVNRLAGIRIGDGHPSIAVSAPDKKGVVPPTDEAVTAMITEVKKTPTTAYVDKVTNEPLLSTLPTPGKVVSEQTVPSLGLTEWKLSNGATVVLKPTDFKNDQVLFSAYSPGGTSLSSDPDYMSASMAGQVMAYSGAGRFDAVELQKMLAGKVVRIYPTFSELSEGFSGSASPQDLETLLQLTYLYATAPRKDTSAFGALMSRILASIQNRSASPEGAFYDTVQVTINQHHFRARPFTVQTAKEINLDKAMTFYKNRYADFDDFTFFFVGTFEPNQIKPLVERYLASLPTNHRKESWRDVGMEPPRGVVDREVFRGVDPKSQIQLIFTGPFDWTPLNKYTFSSLIELLNIKLREVVREEKSGTYGIRCSGSPSLYPRKEYSLRISWGCDPARVDELVKTVIQQVDSLKMTPPDQTYIDKVKEIQKRNREINLKQNQFWMSALRQYFANGENPKQLLDFNNQVDQLTAAEIQDAAKKYFNMKNYVKVVLYPEKKSNE